MYRGVQRQIRQSHLVLDLRVPAFLFNLLTCVVVPLFTVTTLNHWLLWLVRKVAMAVNANCFNFLGLWTCPPLFKYWKRCQYSGTHYALEKVWSHFFLIKDACCRVHSITECSCIYTRLYIDHNHLIQLGDAHS